MNRAKVAGLVLAGAALGASLATAIVLISGASSQEQVRAQAQDVAAIQKTIDRYLGAKKLAWPVSMRKDKLLPSDVKAAMKTGRQAVTLDITDGSLLQWERTVDPGGTLEELRSTGTVTLASGYRILGFGETMIQRDGSAHLVVKIWSWGEYAEWDEASGQIGAPYKVDGTSLRSYTLRPRDGRWRIAEEAILTDPMDPDPGTFGPEG